MEYLVIGLGGFLGANARYVVASWAARQCSAFFPYNAVILNMSGSFIFVFFLACLQD